MLNIISYYFFLILSQKMLLKFLYYLEIYYIKAFYSYVFHCWFHSSAVPPTEIILRSDFAQALYCRQSFIELCHIHTELKTFRNLGGKAFSTNPVIFFYLFTFKTPIILRDINKNAFSARD